jgi:hypothetical protein
MGGMRAKLQSKIITRCGRAGNRDGRGIIFYGTKERGLVDVVRDAEDQQSRMVLKQDVEDDLEDSVLLKTEQQLTIQGQGRSVV